MTVHFRDWQCAARQMTAGCPSKDTSIFWFPSGCPYSMVIKTLRLKVCAQGLPVWRLGADHTNSDLTDSAASMLQQLLQRMGYIRVEAIGIPKMCRIKTLECFVLLGLRALRYILDVRDLAVSQISVLSTRLIKGTAQLLHAEMPLELQLLNPSTVV